MADHPHVFGRDQTVFDPWHYVPVLARKPGALRNGAPFKNWVLPSGLDRVRRKLAGVEDGNRQMVTILTAVLSDGLAAVEAACLAPPMRSGSGTSRPPSPTERTPEKMVADARRWLAADDLNREGKSAARARPETG